MNVAKNTVPSIDYTVSFAGGEVLESSKGEVPLEYLHGAGNLVPGLEAALEGRQTGDQVSTDVPPEMAHGTQDTSLRRAIPRSKLSIAR